MKECECWGGGLQRIKPLYRRKRDEGCETDAKAPWSPGLVKHSAHNCMRRSSKRVWKKKGPYSAQTKKCVSLKYFVLRVSALANASVRWHRNRILYQYEGICLSLYSLLTVFLSQITIKEWPFINSVKGKPNVYCAVTFCFHIVKITKIIKL